MLAVDGHLDLAWNALQWNRDLTLSVFTMRTQEGGLPGKARAQNTVALPEMRRGRVAVTFATLLARSTGLPVAHLDYGSPQQAYAVAQGQLAYYRSLEAAGYARVIENEAALDAHIQQWQRWEIAAPGSGTTPPLGFVISMEGADPIAAPVQLAAWHAAGLRLLGPAHYGPGRYAGGTGTELGFSAAGFELLGEMERLGMILDLTHLSDQAFWQALEQFGGTIIASHNNCRALVPHQRQFSDAQVSAIIQRDGVIGAAFDAWMLQPGWVRGESTNDRVTLATVVDHIDHICQVAGNSRHVALGTDLDGGFGREQSPHDLDTIADLQRIPLLLAQRGYDATAIGAVMHGNWLRVLRTAWSGPASIA